MNVVVPYTRLHPRVLPAIWQQGYGALAMQCVNRVGHVRSYPNILRWWLLANEDVCFIEHDVESRPGFLADLDACPEPWCFYAYDLQQRWEDAKLDEVDFAPLGHTRFRAGVGESIRDLLESTWFGGTWVARDAPVSLAMNSAGFKPHRHDGKAIHLHDYQDTSGVDDASTMSER